MSTTVELPEAHPFDTRRLYTYAELVAELPESNQPCELWDGELMMSPTPSFNHQKIVFRFQRALHDWVAEVISPGGRNRDRIEKRDLYEQHGVKEYWIVDPEAETVDVLALVQGQYELAMRRSPGEIAVSRLLTGFEVSVDYLFHG
jgi:hypothetical protein